MMAACFSFLQCNLFTNAIWKQMQRKACIVCACTTYSAHANELCILCVDYREKDCSLNRESTMPVTQLVCVLLVYVILFLFNLYYRFAFYVLN